MSACSVIVGFHADWPIMSGIRRNKSLTEDNSFSVVDGTSSCSSVDIS